MSMHREEEPPPVDEKYRMALRVAAIFACYGLYYVLSGEQRIPAAFIGIGALLIALAVIDRWTRWRRDRSGLLQVGQTLLGAGLLALGSVLYLT